MRDHSTRMFKRALQIQRKVVTAPAISREPPPLPSRIQGLNVTVWLRASAKFPGQLACVMPKQEIPSRYWTTFLESLTQKHGGWLVRLETCSRRGDESVPARDIALTSITLETRRTDGDEIAVMLSGAG